MIVRSRFQGLETLLIDTPLARCEIALFGAQVLSFIPRNDGRDLLWCSPATLAPGRPVRGGVPLCWPWFAKQDKPDSAVQHGFVRKMPWTVTSFGESSEGEARVVLALSAPRGGWPEGLNWPASCTPQFEVRIGQSLEMALFTRNDSEDTVSLTQALHTYFRVGDVRRIGIDGLQGLSYLDKLRDFNAFTQDDTWTFEGACDRIYLRADAHQRIDDPVLGRSIHIESAHSASAVVWNPGAEGIAALGDVPLKDWYQYVCVEAGNCAPLDRVSLAAGATAVIGQRISAAPLHPSATTL